MKNGDVIVYISVCVLSYLIFPRWINSRNDIFCGLRFIELNVGLLYVTLRKYLLLVSKSIKVYLVN